MAKTSAGLRKWRRKQPKGAIMKPEEFEAHVQEAMKEKGFDRERAERYVGGEYWERTKEKYKKYQRHKYAKK